MGRRAGPAARRLAVGFALWTALAACAAAAPVERTVPARRDPFVVDYAAVVAPEDSRLLRQRLGHLKERSGREVVVLTVSSLAEFGGDARDRNAFVNDVFNGWRVGGDRDDGVLLFVSKGDRFVRVEVGTRFGRRLDAPLKAVVRDVIAPRFRSGDWSGGVVKGVDAILRAVADAPDDASAPDPPTRAFTPSLRDRPLDPATQRVVGFVFAGILAVVAGLVALNVLQRGTEGWGWFVLCTMSVGTLLVLRGALRGRRRRGFFYGGGSHGTW